MALRRPVGPYRGKPPVSCGSARSPSGPRRLRLSSWPWDTTDAERIAAKLMAELVDQGSEVGQINLIVPVLQIEYQMAQNKIYLEKFGLKPAGLVSNPSDDITEGE